ncbi:MAG: hypothetical protein MJ165_01655 [Alphaproteobacteria bacterium]|nr:hypothetical protein [Alphaproteobacteria bacterium]
MKVKEKIFTDSDRLIQEIEKDMKKRDAYKRKHKVAFDNIAKILKTDIYIKRGKNIEKELTSYELLEVSDWTRITPKELQQQISEGKIVDWIDGKDVGPSPLTDALLQGASKDIIEILIINGANVNAPTILPNGKEMTPLEIVRSQAPTHDNVQKELMLQRAGAKDDIVGWLKQDKRHPKNYFKKVEHEGLWQDYDVFSPIPRKPTEFVVPYYIVRKAFTISWDSETDADAWDIFDKPASWGNYDDMALLNNELGDNFAHMFFKEADKVSFNVAQYLYYIYLRSLFFYQNDKFQDMRFTLAAHDFRDRFFTRKDWKQLIDITKNITGKAEYSKMMKERFSKKTAKKK